MAKIVFVGQMGWLVANTKTKRKQLRKKTLKSLKMSKVKISKNGKKLVSHSPKEHILKKLGC